MIGEPEKVLEKIGALGLDIRCHDSVEELEAVGVKLTPESLEDIQRYSYSISTPGPSVDEDKPEFQEHLFEHMSRLEITKKKEWELIKWRYAPGPGPDDFLYRTKSFETLLERIHDLYFGKPTIVDGWEFPIHKHPEWDRDKLHNSIKLAENLNFSQWWKTKRKHEKKHEAKVKRLNRWVFQREHNFYDIPNMHPVGKTCRLRMDLQKVYYIENPAQEKIIEIFGEHYERGDLPTARCLHDLREIISHNYEVYFPILKSIIANTKEGVLLYRALQALNNSNDPELLNYNLELIRSDERFIRVAAIRRFRIETGLHPELASLIDLHLSRHPEDDPSSAEGKAILELPGLISPY